MRRRFWVPVAAFGVSAAMVFAPQLHRYAWAGPSAQEVEASAGGDLLTVFAQYGPLGVITALLVWFARGAHQRERERADRMEEDNKRLNGIILDRVIPALTEATRAAEESAALLRDLHRERERVVVGEQRTAKGRQTS